MVTEFERCSEKMWWHRGQTKMRNDTERHSAAESDLQLYLKIAGAVPMDLMSLVEKAE